MATNTSIEWTDATWNCVRGCARVSAGCENCYAERVAYRFGQRPSSPYEGLTVLGKHGPRWNGRARFVPELLGEPLHWRKPRRVFVNSMSDLFHEDISDEQIAAVFGIMASSPQHTFQVLTKRPSQMLRWFAWLAEQHPDPRTHVLASALSEELRTGTDAQPLHVKHCADPDGPWPLPNVWLGVSCEDQSAANARIPLLRRCPAAVHFVSAEPLLGELDLERWLEWTPTGPDENGEAHLLPPLRWLIVGGESGPGARRCNVDWVRSIARQCSRALVPCFVKQLGARAFHGEEGFRCDGEPHEWAWLEPQDRKGGDPSEWPSDLRVREFPEVQP